MLRSHKKRFAVIMAGGAGTRFWPLSRRSRPKQLLPIASTRTMLQDTVARLRTLVPVQQIVVVVGRAHAIAVREQLPAVPRRNILIEPFGRNTAPCVAVAVEWIHRRAPESTMVVLPADHAIADAAAFRRVLRRAFAIAERKQALVMLGVAPTRAETGYGYIKSGVPLDRARPTAANIARFCEKPDAATARRMMASGRYRWNAGIFVWPTAVIRAALAHYAPRVALPIRQLRVVGQRISAALYRRLPSVSIDVAVMEPAVAETVNRLAVVVVAADFGWSDVGSWAAMSALWGCDRAGNALRGNVVVIDSKHVTALADRRLVALLGVRDLIVVDSPDALLICPSNRVQDVQQIVAEIERRGQSKFL